MRNLRILAACLPFILLTSCSTEPRVVIKKEEVKKPEVAQPPSYSTGQNGIYDVRGFGAVGDGKTKSTAAFQKALDACATAGGGTVVVTSGVYVIGSVVIGTNTTLRVEGRTSLMGSPDIADYPLLRVRWEGEFRQGHRALIYAEKTRHVSIIGRGSFIYGPPISVSRLRDPRGPALIEFSECEDVTLEGFTTQYEQLWSIHPVLCKHFTARNLTIRTVASNGDGLDIDSCSDVLVERCNVDTGDDAVVLKSGRGAAAAGMDRPTENVVIRDCILVSSQFAGFGIGTELSGGVRNVRLENCTISGRQNAIFLKSRDGRGGYIENVVGENLTVMNSPTFLGIALLRTGIQASDPVQGDIEKWTLIRNVTFNNVTVHNISNLVMATAIPQARPIENLTLSNFKGDCARGIRLGNATNTVLSEINVTGFTGELVTRTSVENTNTETARP